MKVTTSCWKRSKGKGKPPVRSLKEFSREVGVAYSTLYNRMRASTDSPEVQYTSGQSGFRLYIHAELHKWHNSYDNTKLKEKG